MTFIQQFIEKALVGGWQPTDRAFSIIGFYDRHFEYEIRGEWRCLKLLVHFLNVFSP